MRWFSEWGEARRTARMKSFGAGNRRKHEWSPRIKTRRTNCPEQLYTPRSVRGLDREAQVSLEQILGPDPHAQYGTL